MKNLSAFYLYSDVHAVAIYEQLVKGNGIEYAEIFDGWVGVKCSLLFAGRIVFHRYAGGLVHLTKGARSIQVAQPAVDRGSDASKRLGLKVGSLSIWAKNIKGEIQFDTLPDVMAGRFTLQPEVDEKFNPGLTQWGTAPVNKIHRV